MILFTDPTGPKLAYGDGVLHVSDLNPEVELGWRMSRWDMIKLGLRCIRAAGLRDSVKAIRESRRANRHPVQ